jgi:hypothetical protein
MPPDPDRLCGRAPPGNEAARRSRSGEAEPKRFISNTSNGRPQPRDARQCLGDRRFRRDVERLHALGPRPLFQMLVELGRDRLIRTEIETIVGRYVDRLDPTCSR